jgi:hypothetical protein
MAERREFVRRAIERVVLVGVDAQSSAYTFMRDISRGGMSVKWVSGIPLCIGHRVNVELPLGRSKSRLKTAAVVCGVSRDTATDSARVHLQFTDSDLAFRRLITDTLVCA